MTSALIYLNGAYPSLALDLEAAGMRVTGTVYDCSKLVQETLRQGPDVLVCRDALPGDELFRALETIGETSARPVVVFTQDGDAGKIARAVEAGVHAYVVNGYSPARLRPVIHLAQARFGREQALRDTARDIARRFEERKMVDRAKGILMRARQVSDDDAFQILRTASMHSNQRLGQVSEQIIRSARFAEDVNRSGQLRMLSQRLVKLALLQVLGVQPALVEVRLQESLRRIDANIAALGKSLSPATFGDLLGQVVETWAQLRQALQSGLQNKDVAQLDALAEQLLQEAERLTAGLESAGAVSPLKVLNLAGRQRMLCQRFAKCALLAGWGDRSGSQGYEASMADARTAFEQALRYLNDIPLTSPDIRTALEAAGQLWLSMLTGAAPVAGEPGGKGEGPTHSQDSVRLGHLATASEELLDVFELLSAHYERSMQMLVGAA